MAYLPVQVVDEDDKVIGSAPLEDVWRTGQIHRIVRIMVEDEAGRILLQKRSAHVGLFPLCWDHSAAGHVDEGDTYETAVKRELQEELGIAGVPLKEIAHYRTDHTVDGHRLNRFNKLYKTVVKADQSLHIDEHEVAEARWFTLNDIEKLIHDHPNQVTEGLVQAMKDYY
jgi:isopentenyldiphosphate isomerase